MSTVSLRLPDSLHRKIRQLADRDDISINQFIATAVAEKTAALLTVDYLEERGRRGDVRLFDRALTRVPDVPPMPGNELPNLPLNVSRLTTRCSRRVALDGRVDPGVVHERRAAEA